MEIEVEHPYKFLWVTPASEHGCLRSTRTNAANTPDLAKNLFLQIIYIFTTLSGMSRLQTKNFVHDFQ